MDSFSSRIPLAERMRPQSLEEVIGQSHLLGKNEILHKIVENKEPVSLILWGPPGSGKTTLARVIAKEVEAEFVELSAVTSGKKDVEKVIEHARQNWNLQLRTLLFVDEIHRFNKAQQDFLLPVNIALCSIQRSSYTCDLKHIIVTHRQIIGNKLLLSLLQLPY